MSRRSVYPNEHVRTGVREDLSPVKDVPPAPELLPHAYAHVQDAQGGWHALHLEGVSAQKVTRLEPNARPEPGMFAASRVTLAIERQFRMDMRANAARGRAGASGAP